MPLTVESNQSPGLFNRQLLVGIFVSRLGTSPDFTEKCDWDNDPHSPRCTFTRLITSWWLQGFLLRRQNHDQEHSKWMDAIQAAAVQVKSWADEQSSGLSNTIAHSQPVGVFTSDNPSTKFHRITEIVCDALICHLGPQDVSELVFRPEAVPKLCQVTTSHIVYLTACFIGDITTVQASLRVLEAEAEKMDAEIPVFAASGLYVAARQGHTRTTQYLLDAGIDATTLVVWDDGLSAAAQSGKIAIVELFLRPEYKSQSSAYHYEWAVINAAQQLNDLVRIEMVKLLFAYVTDPPAQKRVRTDLLYSACKVNDPKLAEWVIGNGPASIYDRHSIPTSNTHPLVAATQYQNIEILRLLLKGKFDVYDTYHLDAVRSRALSRAIYGNHLKSFIELVPYISWTTSDRILWRHATRVENGVEAVEKLLGPYNLDSSMEKDGELTLGACVLREAILALRPQNVTWLLSRGIRTNQDIPVWEYEYQLEIVNYNKMDALLREYQNPGLRVFKSESVERNLA